MARPHALVLPVPMQGHINPMFNLSLQLATRGGFIITFVNTKKAHKRGLESNQSEQQSIGSSSSSGGGEIDIRFASIADGTDEPLPGQAPAGSFQTQVVSVHALLDGIATQQGLLQDTVIESRATPHPITCVIFDSFLPWAQAMASKLGIKAAGFWTSAAATFATTIEMGTGRLDAAENAPIHEVTAGLPIRSSEWLSTVPSFQDPHLLELFRQRVAAWPEVACLVLNTLQELEAPSLQAVIATGCEINMRCVGPLLPPGGASVKGVTFYPEQRSTCVDWLEQQAPGSVLYISFGSVVALPAQQLEELALGVELSKQPFLWVSRDTANLFPEGFLDRTRGRGLVVNWAPQVEVLGHAAVGGFLTHCGWNSTVESIHMGVPMLCFPAYADQHLNALLITTCWGMGTGMRKDEQHLDLYSRSEVQSAIATLLNSDELRLKAATWKAASHRAVKQGGSSYSALESVIHDLGA